MVTTLRSFSGFSVDDADAALRFYRDTLGLPARENAMGGLDIDLTDGSTVFVYPGWIADPAGNVIALIQD